MAKIAIVFGVLMTVLGLWLYFDSESRSPTALIPAGFGVPLIVLGAIAAGGSDRTRMHTMHGAAMIGVLAALLSLGRLGMVLARGGAWNLALTGMVLLGALSVTFVALCVQSFIAARRARKAREAQPPGA